MGQVYDWGDVQSGSGTTAPTPGVVESFQQRFFTAVAELDAVIVTLREREQQLLAVSGTVDDAELQAEIDNALGKIQTANTVIDGAQDAAASVSTWIAEIRQYLGMAGLGVAFAAPFATLAIITAAVVTLNYFVSGWGQLIDRATLLSWQKTNESLAAQGLPLQPRPALVSSGGLFSGTIDNLGKLLLIGGIVWFLAPRLFKK